MYRFMVFFEVDGFGVSVMQGLNYLFNSKLWNEKARYALVPPQHYSLQSALTAA